MVALLSSVVEDPGFKSKETTAATTSRLWTMCQRMLAAIRMVRLVP